MAFTISGPSAIGMDQGTSVSVQIRVTLTDKPPRSVSLSVTGLPSGVSAQFSPSSGKPSFSSMLRITSGLSSTVGTFNLLVTGRDGKSSRSMPIVFSNYSVNIPPNPPPGVYPADFYMAPASRGGNDSNPGTYAQPFETLSRVHTAMSAGQLCYALGGNYAVTANVKFSKDGSSGNLFKLYAYPGEVPIFDGSGVPQTGGNNDTCILAIQDANYWHIKGLTFTLCPGSGVLLYSSSGNIILEQCVGSYNGANGGVGIGAYGTGGHDYQIINCDAHHNSDGDGNADGIQLCIQGGGTNIVRGCRAWRNSDDGFDFYNVFGSGTMSPWLIDNCWAWKNGYDDGDNPLGDGNGYKLGGGGASGGQTVQRCLAFANKWTGFFENEATIPITLYNNTSYSNDVGIGFYFHVTSGHVAKNNIAHDDIVDFNAGTTHSNNTWDSGVTLDNGDFQSLDMTGVDGPRQADGSLPNLTFLKLAGGSDLINAGTDVGLPFNGPNPDMGAFET